MSPKPRPPAKPAPFPCHSRVRTVRCQSDDSTVLGWRWQAVYAPKRRSLLETLRIRWTVQLRTWGYL